MPSRIRARRHRSGLMVVAEPEPPPEASALAHDAQTQTAAFATAAAHDTTHTPVGTPKGVAVVIIQALLSGSTNDEISGVTYGGVPMTRVRRQDRTGSMTETGCIYLYFLGAGIPTGAQTVSITSTGTAAKRAVISTVTADGDTAVDADDGTALNTGANPSLALTFTEALASAEIYYGLGTGLASPVSTAEAGSTHQFGHDFGAESAMWARKSVDGVSSTTIGYTATSDDQTQAALVIRDAA